MSKSSAESFVCFVFPSDCSLPLWGSAAVDRTRIPLFQIPECCLQNFQSYLNRSFTYSSWCSHLFSQLKSTIRQGWHPCWTWTLCLSWKAAWSGCQLQLGAQIFFQKPVSKHRRFGSWVELSWWADYGVSPSPTLCLWRHVLISIHLHHPGAQPRTRQYSKKFGKPDIFLLGYLCDNLAKFGITAALMCDHCSKHTCLGASTFSKGTTCMTFDCLQTKAEQTHEMSHTILAAICKEKLICTKAQRLDKLSCTLLGHLI